jgi:hypothetical protein
MQDQIPWLPLEGMSSSSILAQQHDPLSALDHGLVPAIIIRGLLKSDESSAVTQRLQWLHHNQGLTKNGCNQVSNQSPAWMRVTSDFATLGPDLPNCLLNGNPQTMTQRAQWFEKLALEHNLSRPIDAFHLTIQELAAGRRVARAIDVQSSQPLLPASFRRHKPGNKFPLHFDTLHTHVWDGRACGTGGLLERNLSKQSLAQPRRTGQLARLYPDIVRFRSQLAAIVVLQTSETAAAEVAVYESHWEDLLGDCTLAGASHSGGVYIRGFRGSARAASARMVNITLHAGDFYIFNSNRVHEVHRILGTRDRMTMAAAAGFDARDLRIWA